jgi:hypothetical protein
VAQLGGEIGWPVLALDEADAASLEKIIRAAWDAHVKAPAGSIPEKSGAVRRSLAELSAGLTAGRA